MGLRKRVMAVVDGWSRRWNWGRVSEWGAGEVGVRSVPILFLFLVRCGSMARATCGVAGTRPFPVFVRSSPRRSRPGTAQVRRGRFRPVEKALRADLVNEGVVVAAEVTEEVGLGLPSLHGVEEELENWLTCGPGWSEVDIGGHPADDGFALAAP